MSTKTPLVSVVLLAAGKSERMGRNKLLMPLGRGTIIERTLDNLLATRVNDIIVVLGGCAQEVCAAIGKRPVASVLNPDYARGMSTSLLAGLQMITKKAQYVMVALGDQPFITQSTYDKLVEAALGTNKGIVVPTFNGQRGNPITFHTNFIPEVMCFTGDVGGRELLVRYPNDVLEVTVPDEGIIINVNTPGEYEKRIGSAGSIGGLTV